MCGVPILPANAAMLKTKIASPSLMDCSLVDFVAEARVNIRLLRRVTRLRGRRVFCAALRLAASDMDGGLSRDRAIPCGNGRQAKSRYTGAQDF